MLKFLPKNRSCEGCTACCTTHAVEELKKPVNSTCQHCSTTDCSIYDRRPESCREFMCLWLQGYSEYNARPDKSGVVLDHFVEGVFSPILMIWEYTEGAIETPFVQSVQEDALRAGDNVMFWYKSGRKKIFFPNGKVVTKKIKEELEDFDIEVGEIPIFL